MSDRPLPMNDIITTSETKDEIKVERPRLYKVILINDDYTPREFVVMVLKAECPSGNKLSLLNRLAAPS
jgi:ATP-dependent Clp protease adapter protein ClpS